RIHSSVLSSTSQISWLSTTLLGRYAPTPRTAACRDPGRVVILPVPLGLGPTCSGAGAFLRRSGMLSAFFRVETEDGLTRCHGVSVLGEPLDDRAAVWRGDVIGIAQGRDGRDDLAGPHARAEGAVGVGEGALG